MPRPERAPHDKTARFDAIYTPTTPSEHLRVPLPRADSTFPALFLPYDTHFCRERWNRHRHPPGNME